MFVVAGPAAADDALRCSREAGYVAVEACTRAIKSGAGRPSINYTYRGISLAWQRTEIQEALARQGLDKATAPFAKQGPSFVCGCVRSVSASGHIFGELLFAARARSVPHDPISKHEPEDGGACKDQSDRPMRAVFDR
jgi:hypothetical protein